MEDINICEGIDDRLDLHGAPYTLLELARETSSTIPEKTDAELWRVDNNSEKEEEEEADFKIMTSESNPGVLAVCYAQGWCASEEYMLKSEAEAVTDIDNAFEYNNTIASFDEFKYFIGVTEIVDNAFSNCKNLTNITLPKSLTTIGEDAFMFCINLSSINIPNSVTDIKLEAFSNTAIKSITIPDSVTVINLGLFNNCYNLSSITLGDKITTIYPGAFDNTKFYNNTSNWDDNGALYLNKYLIRVKTDVSGVYTIKEDTTCIAGQSFYQCKDLTSVIISDSIVDLGIGIFEECTNLTSVTIPESVTSINSFAFNYCPNLSTIICKSSTAPISDSYTFGEKTFTYTGRNTYDQGVNKLYVPTGATGYTDSYWGSVLLDSSKCGFTLVEVDNFDTLK